jgi:integrase
MGIDCTGRNANRSDRTVAAYRRRFEGLRLAAEREHRAGGDLLDVIDWFCEQDGRWAESTIRQYRAALMMELELSAFLPAVRSALFDQLQRGPSAKMSGQRRTSARKRKSLPVAEFMRLEQILKASGRADDKLLRGFLVFGAAIFLRPVEYLNARVEGMTLFVMNAKATNGRANGKERERNLAPMGKKAIATLVTFLNRLRAAVEEAGTWKLLHDRLASRLARVCKSVGIARVSLYTLRHVGIATAKRWMSPIEVAAAAGHASARTAMSHYAKRRTGWIGLRLAGLPSTASIRAVRGELKFFVPQPRSSLPALK